MTVKSRLLNILTLLVLILVLFSFPAFAGIQEVNSTIERNSFSKIDLPIGINNKVTINLTANKSVDIFIFSEKDLIDYQVNSIIKPTHLSWFKLNTTSFYVENITIYPPGTYFILVDNTDIPLNGGKTNSSITLKGEIVIYPLETEINYLPIFILIIIVIIFFILCLLYYIIYSKKDAIQQSTFFFLSIVILAVLISEYGYNLGFNYDASVLGFLSSLIQTLVSLFAILFTMILILTQILAQTYPFQIVKYILKDKKIIGFLLYYIITIIIGIYNIIRNDISYWPITGFVILTIMLIMAILPYIFITLEELLKPKKIIEYFLKDINKKNVVLSAEKLGVGDRVKFCSEKDQQSEDPIQPLSDIALNAISKQNHEMARIVICEINIKSKEFISNENNEEDSKKLTKLFGYHLFHIGKTAIANKDVENLDLVIKTLQNLSKLPRNELAINESIDYLIMLGSYCANNGFVSDAYNVINILKDAALKGHHRVVTSSITGIIYIGKILIQNKSIIITQPPIISNLGKIAKQLLEEKEGLIQTLEKLSDISFLGGLPVNYRSSSFESIEDIIKTREKRITKLIEDEIPIGMDELRVLALQYDIQIEIFSSYKVMNDILEISDRMDIKYSCPL